MRRAFVNNKKNEISKSPLGRSLREKKSIDISFVLGLLDLFIKLGAVSLIPSGIIVYLYLISIGFRGFIGSAIGSQGGLISIFLFLGVLFIFSVLIFSYGPWIIWKLKKEMDVEKYHYLFSFKTLFGLVMFNQSVFFFLASMEGTYFFWWTIVFFTIPIIPLIDIRKIGFSFLECVKYCGLMGFALFFAIFPWIYLAPILNSVEVSQLEIFGYDIFQSLLFSIWILFYSISSASLVSSASKKMGRSEGQDIYMIKKCLLSSFFLLMLVASFSPKFFVTAAVYGAGLKEIQQDSKWYAIDSPIFKKIVLNKDNFKTSKEVNGVVYACGYSAFLATDKLILCPQHVFEPNSMQCSIFSNSEVRQVTTNFDGEWVCGEKKGNKFN
ncbi:hypothetical protein [Undibacterium squillarum]|uniref:Uncharacterized protein n=1 Tax=Undibacterium squillarum TaxID=1131567 RepID=A0ABQ2XZB2_9BURK|nr:hypothetical protein [Undibacterium squillarum]GGX38585.1 hypothetical protein GCM10010946_16080 [Undibacterium squillarum]